MKTPHQASPSAELPRTTFSAAAAARGARVGRATIQRALAANQFPGATKGEHSWEIPLNDLILAGFSPIAMQPQEEAVARRSNLPNDVEELRTELLSTQDKLEAETAARRTAELLAEERALHIKDLRKVVALLSEPTTHPMGTTLS
ncbi:hypothetical protein [Rhodococcus sp. NPDC060084]|uniref:hypothetical protein n=1 Tax=Rhodococcus sp. NPDC060084 TaxID=3347053 RepID=UPI00365AFB32